MLTLGVTTAFTSAPAAEPGTSHAWGQAASVWARQKSKGVFGALESSAVCYHSLLVKGFLVREMWVAWRKCLDVWKKNNTPGFSWGYQSHFECGEGFNTLQ